MSEAPYVLHIWPSKWNLQSLDPTCLAAVMYLQLTIPGKFKVAPCTNPDKSPNGQLPFLTHGHIAVSTFPSIVAFVTSLAKTSGASGAIDLDAPLTSSQKAEKVALYAHVESCISDLVSHMFYGNDTNFWGLTNPVLASEMPIPQKYYVGSRIRETYKPRLEAAGLWSLPNEEEKKGLFEKDKKKKREYTMSFSRAFEREKILDKAKTMLGVHASYLGGKQFFFGDRPTSLDVYLAAHILLLADPPFPDAILQIQLLEYYQRLIDHARRIQAQVARVPPYEQFTASGSLLSSLIPRSFSGSRAQPQVDPADIQYKRKTLVYILGTLAVTVAYLYTQVLPFIASAGDSAESENDEDGGGDSEGGEGELEGTFSDEDED
ncbi:hypothetical protein EV363DRAFT_1429122 [Boletus edulis]|nr:hypothetical protein EV363DRAFT_1429122 [Boletus edulis]